MANSKSSVIACGQGPPVASNTLFLTSKSAPEMLSMLRRRLSPVRAHWKLRVYSISWFIPSHVPGKPRRVIVPFSTVSPFDGRTTPAAAARWESARKGRAMCSRPSGSMTQSASITQSRG